MAAEYGSMSTPDLETMFDDGLYLALMPKTFFWTENLRLLDLPPVSAAYDYSGLSKFVGCYDGCHSDKKMMLQAPEEGLSCKSWSVEEINFVGLGLLLANWKNDFGRTKLSHAPRALDYRSTEFPVSGYGDPKIGRGNVMGDGHNSHPGTGGVGGTDKHDHGGYFGSGAGHDVEGHGHISYRSHLGSGGCGGTGGVKARYKLADVPFERIRFLLTSAAVYFATLGFSNTIIAHDVRRDSNGAHSIITDLAKGNHMFFQMFTLVNIFGFATSSGALLIRVRGKLKSEVMFMTCSTIAFLCMALSLSVLVCVFVSLGALAATGSNV